MKETAKDLARTNQNELPAARTLEVSLDRADNVIEGGLPRRWYDKKSSLPEKLLTGALRRDCRASGISRQMADLNGTPPNSDGNQDAQRSLETMLDSLN